MNTRHRETERREVEKVSSGHLGEHRPEGKNVETKEDPW